MVLRPEFSLGHSEFNEFLWASTGIDENGTPLSVLSGLARLGLDPWKEAARLTSLPKDVAVAALAAQISRLPRPQLPRMGAAMPDHVTTAGRLVALLQNRIPTAPVRNLNGRRLRTSRFVVGLIVVLLAAILIGMVIREAPPGPDDRPPSFGYIAPAS
jgi:hypothetical protein